MSNVSLSQPAVRQIVEWAERNAQAIEVQLGSHRAYTIEGIVDEMNQFLATVDTILEIPFGCSFNVDLPTLNVIRTAMETVK